MTPEDRAVYQQAVLDWLDRKVGGHFERWIYGDVVYPRWNKSGSGLWQAFVTAARNQYYIIPNELVAVERAVHRYERALRGIDTEIDFGVGPPRSVSTKAMTVAAGCPNLKDYAGVDLSDTFLEGARGVVKQMRPDLRFHEFHNDYYRDRFRLPGRRKLGLLLGNTLGNAQMTDTDLLPAAVIVDRLRHFRRLLGKDSRFWITFDKNHEELSVIDAYNHVHCKRFITGLMYRIHSELKPEGNYNFTAWQHRFLWRPEAHVLHHMIEATQNQDFAIAGHEFSFRKGEF